MAKIIGYIGGKARIGKWIKEFIPEDIETYVESFGGMYWTYFNMDLDKYKNLKTIVYNDFNPHNVNLFKCMQTEGFHEYVKDVPSQKRDLFDTFKKYVFSRKPDLSKPDFRMALGYVYILGNIFSGINPEKSGFIDLKGKYNSRFNAFKNKFNKPDFMEKINKITYIENMDFAEIMDKYDSDKTYFYTDPPYWKTENYYSQHDFDTYDHYRLAEYLKKIKGRFSLSYYDFEALNKMFPKDVYKWEQKEFTKASSSKKKKSKGEELLIMNY